MVVVVAVEPRVGFDDLRFRMSVRCRVSCVPFQDSRVDEAEAVECVVTRVLVEFGEI